MPAKQKLSTRDQAAELIRTRPAEIARIRKALAMDFETPAQSSINAGFCRMGIDRFRSGDDLWEMIQAIENGTEYERPAARLIARWRMA